MCNKFHMNNMLHDPDAACRRSWAWLAVCGRLVHKLPRGRLTAQSREAMSPALAWQRDPIAILHALLPVVLHDLQGIAEGALQQGDHLLAASTDCRSLVKQSAEQP